jgi:hypothetical protein
MPVKNKTRNKETGPDTIPSLKEVFGTVIPEITWDFNTLLLLICSNIVLP